MRFRGPGFEFRMILNRNEPRVVFDFDNFDKRIFFAGRSDHQAVGFHLLAILVVELIAMAMAFMDLIGLVASVRDASGANSRILSTQSHCATFVGDVALFVEQTDHRMFCIFVELA